MLRSNAEIKLLTLLLCFVKTERKKLAYFCLLRNVFWRGQLSIIACNANLKCLSKSFWSFPRAFGNSPCSSPYLRYSAYTTVSPFHYWIVLNVDCFTQGTLRVLLVLLHDFPEFLCDYHFSFCDVIPPNCIQMRNLILSAFPRNMRLPDPFTPNLKVIEFSSIHRTLYY